MKTAVIGEDDRGPHRLQPHPARPRPPLRLPAQGLPALPGQDQGQGGAAVPLRPRGLLPRPQLPQPRRPERPVPPVARPGRQPRRARAPRGGSSSSTSPRSGRTSSRCRPGRSRPCSGSSGASPARAWSRSAATLLRARRHPPARPSRSRHSPTEVRILEDGQLIAAHPVLEGRGQRRIAAGHRKPPRTANAPPARRRGRRRSDGRAGELVARARWPSTRPSAGGSPPGSRPSMTAAGRATLDRIRAHLVGLRMPRALEVLEPPCANSSAARSPPSRRSTPCSPRSSPCARAAGSRRRCKMGRLATIKTLAGFDFSFQPSLDRNRILALAELDFIDRHEVVHFLGQPGSGKTPPGHRARRRGGEGRPQRLLHHPGRPHRLARQGRARGRLRERIRFLCRPRC